MHVRDLKPGMSAFDIKVTVIEISEPKQIITNKGVNHEILEAKAEDETGAITLVLWNEKIMLLKVGDVLQIGNGYVTSFKGEWKINVGKYSEITKV